MSKKIFVNLPVADLPKAKSFYEAIGAVNNPQFSDNTAACMVVSDSIYVMLLTHPKWATFTQSLSSTPMLPAKSCCA
jgi:predicted lactoylglutathione lyase